VARKLSRAAAHRAATDACARCALRRRYCVCAALVALPARAAHGAGGGGGGAPPPPPRLFVSVVVAAFELGRASSTHKLVAATLGAGAARGFVLDSEEDGGAREIWATVRAQARALRQRVCFLFPSEEARRFPDVWREEVALEAAAATATTNAAAASLPLQPQPRRAALHVVAFDATWKGARRMHRVMLDAARADAAADAEALAAAGDATGAAAALAAAPCDVVVRNAYRMTLFQPLRRQPTPERVSTLEAVACCFDDVERARCSEGGGCAAIAAAAATSTIADGLLPPAAGEAEEGDNASEASGDERRAAGAPPAASGALAHAHAHDDLIAACPSFASRALRLNLCCLVDQLSREKGGLGREFGRGPGYRTWRLPAAEVGARLGSLPAHLIERIAVFAYGRARVLASGYALHASRSGAWASGDGADAEAEAEDTHDEEASASAPAAAAVVAPRRRRLCLGGLPMASAFTRGVALALTNSHIYCLLNGERKLERVVGPAAARRIREKDAASAAARAAAAGELAGDG